MELWSLWRVLRRRWLLVVLPAAVVLVLALLTYSPPAQMYNAGVRFIASQDPSSAADDSDEERLANWKASEYAVNTLADWVHGGQFAELISQRMADQGLAVSPGDIQGGLTSDSTRSMMTLSISYPDEQLLPQIMDAAAAVLMEENDKGLPQLGGEPAELVQLDQPIVNPVPPGLSSQLELPFRILLALAVGIGVALLVEYLDPTVRGRGDLESFGLTVIGEIPRK